MKKIFYTIKKVNKVDGYKELLPPHIIEHCNKYHESDDLITSLFAYITLKELLNNFNLSINDVYFSNNGKPLINNGYISLSHSKEYVCVSYSQVNHGVDIEVKKEIHYSRIVKKYFDNDLEEIKDLDNFYKIWTKKEAGVKMNDGNILDKRIHNIKYHLFSIISLEEKIYLSIVNDIKVDYQRL